MNRVALMSIALLLCSTGEAAQNQGACPVNTIAEAAISRFQLEQPKSLAGELEPIVELLSSQVPGLNALAPALLSTLRANLNDE